MKFRVAALLLLAILTSSRPGLAATQEPPRIVLLENSDRNGRLHYPLLISNKRGYRIRCASQVDEETIIRGLGVISPPAEKLTALDQAVKDAAPLDNPLLCPSSAENYVIKLFTVAGENGREYYLQFPTDFSSASYLSRFYRPGCNSLVEALGLDLEKAEEFDPRPIAGDQIHDIQCLKGKLLPPRPETFAGWCSKTDLTEAEKKTVTKLLEQTPSGPEALGDEAECAKAQAFLTADTNTALDLARLGLTELGPLSSLTNLTRLSLADNQIEDIRDLEKLTKLTSLDLSENRIENISALKLMAGLVAADLSANKITSLRPLAGNQALMRLTLAHNRIIDVSPLRFLQALAVLDLADNQLSDTSLAPLTTLAALENLNLSYNLIGSLESVRPILKYHPALTDNPVCWDYLPPLIDVCYPSGAMLMNVLTRKCLTIAGGLSDKNSIPALQFSCDSDPSRRWQLIETDDGYQIKNMQTHKCLTIAGGVSEDNNIPAVQFDCDDDLSRRWILVPTTGNDYQVKNLQTGKCLAIAGGSSTDNNIPALQFDCDGDRSRYWWVVVRQ